MPSFDFAHTTDRDVVHSTWRSTLDPLHEEMQGTTMIFLLAYLASFCVLASGFCVNGGHDVRSKVRWSSRPSTYARTTPLSSTRRLECGICSKTRCICSKCRLSMSIPGTVPREVMFEPGNIQILRFLGKIELSMSTDRSSARTHPSIHPSIHPSRFIH